MAGPLRLLCVAIALTLGPILPVSADYEELVAQARQGKSEIDYTALRNAYAASTSYNPYTGGVPELRRPFEQAFVAGDCETAIRHGEAILEKNYVNIDAHLILGVCHRRLGHMDQSQHHTAVGRGIVRSILASGDGRAPETAYVVISVAEEYSLLGVLGARKVRQSLVSKDGRNYDLLVVQNKEGASEQIYFNVDRVLAWASKEIAPRK